MALNLPVLSPAWVTIIKLTHNNKTIEWDKISVMNINEYDVCQLDLP